MLKFKTSLEMSKIIHVTNHPVGVKNHGFFSTQDKTTQQKIQSELSKPPSRFEALN